jgi:hypothetical protein
VAKDCVRLKLDRSAAEARKLGAQVGAGGWAKVESDGMPPAAVLKRWVAESYGLIGGARAGKKPAAATTASRKRK